MEPRHSMHHTECRHWSQRVYQIMCSRQKETLKAATSLVACNGSSAVQCITVYFQIFLLGCAGLAISCRSNTKIKLLNKSNSHLNSFGGLPSSDWSRVTFDFTISLKQTCNLFFHTPNSIKATSHLSTFRCATALPILAV